MLMTNNDMNNSSSIERIVMRRVHLIRILRVVVSGATASCLLLLIALYGIGREVWVAHVFQNAPHHISDVPRFYVAAFNHTRLTVQVLSVLCLASFIYLAREASRSVSSIFIPRHT